MIGSIRRYSIKRKNFFPTLVLTIILWSLVAGLIYFVDPDTFGALPLFFILVFLGSLFTFSLLLGNSRRGFIVSLGLTLFLVLQYLGIGNILNLLIITGLAVTSELYFSRK